jgi:AraC family transcriptional regulator of adaptative response / DNA-3-methyladenine glycosylase II
MRAMSAMVPRSSAAPARPARAGDDADPPARRVAYRAPLDWRSLLGFLGQRAIAGVEWVDPAGADGGATYRRVVRVPGRRGGPARVGWIEVASPPPRPGAAAKRPALAVRVDPALGDAMPALLARVRHALDLRCRPAEVAAALGALAAGHEGLRLPGAFDPYEIGVRAILGQQITVRQARVLAGRFVAAFGEPVATPWPVLTHAFPTAAAVAARDPAEIGALGVTRQRARTLVALADAVASGAIDLSPSADPTATIERLRAVPGIGDWTAQYLAMRALRHGDAFPAADVGVMRALGVTTPRAAVEAAEAFRPWRGYAVIHLWRSLAPVVPEEVPR